MRRVIETKQQRKRNEFNVLIKILLIKWNTDESLKSLKPNIFEYCLTYCVINVPEQLHYCCRHFLLAKLCVRVYLNPTQHGTTMNGNGLLSDWKDGKAI